MKKKAAVILCAAAMLAGTLATGGGAYAKSYDLPDEYRVAGGKVSYDFSSKLDESAFEFFTEFDLLPHVVDEKIVCWPLAEQKIVYKKAAYGNVDISVDVGTINDRGKFDAGIYVGLSNNVSGKIDGATGYCVNLERGADRDTYFLKLHRFDQAWLGAKVEIDSLVLPMNTVHLRVVVKNGVLYAFAGGADSPQITYNIGVKTGYVGFRSFYSPNTFDNVEIIGDIDPIDTTEINGSISTAQGMLDTVTQNSRIRLETALAAARESKTLNSAYEIERAATALKTAISGAVVKRDYATLQNWIAEADGKANVGGNKYTVNSWSAFCKVKEMCKTLTAESDEDTLSYWANRLRLRLDTLIEI